MTPIKKARVIGIDPGNAMTAWVLLADDVPAEHDKDDNAAVIARIRTDWEPGVDLLAVEMIASYGMPVGKEVFDTCLWIGRFLEAWEARGGKTRLVYRKEVKVFHCETTRANDANIRAALIDRYGPGKEKAVGLTRSKGPLFGLKGDEWSALAVALTAQGKPVDPPLFREPAPVRVGELALEKDPF